MSAALLRNVLGAAALCLLAACAGGGAATQELKTASDQTAAEKRAAIRLQLAVGYFQDGKYEIALDEVKQAIAVNPQSAEAYGVRGLIYAAMNENALADENFQHALRIAPKNADLANNYGTYLCNAGARPAQGLQYLEQALKNPAYQSPLSALVNAGNCSLKLKNTEAAERYLLEALRYAPDHAAVNAALVRVYYERRDYVRAGFFVNRLTETAKPETLSADTLWLALKVERKLGNRELEKGLASQLAKRFPGSPEYAAMQRGAFDE